MKRLAGTQTRVEHACDHGVLEAIYLRDPDDNGIDLDADRPRERWRAPRIPGDRVEMPTIALDLDDLLRRVDGEDPRAHAGSGLVVGHVHVHVSDVGQALDLIAACSGSR